MNFKKVEGQVITLMKELNREMNICCGNNWDLCKQCRWNKEVSNGISICDNHTELYPSVCLGETVCEADYDTIEQVVRSLSDEISNDCIKCGEYCDKCYWNRVTENGQTFCDLHTEIMGFVIAEDMRGELFE